MAKPQDRRRGWRFRAGRGRERHEERKNFHADRADLEEATPGAHANVRGLGGELIDEKEPFGRAVAPGSSGLDRHAFLKCMNYMHSIVVIYVTHIVKRK